MLKPELDYCVHMLRRPSRLDPPEYCDNLAEEGSEYCRAHRPLDPDYDREYRWGGQISFDFEAD